MKKSYLVYIGLGMVLILLFLLYRKNGGIYNPNQPVNNVTYNYQGAEIPKIDFKSTRSCGCNPQASQYMSNASNALSKAQDDFNKQLQAWVEKSNGYFQSDTIN